MKRLLTFAGLAVFACNAFASVTLLTSRAQITETDYIDWGDLGADYTAPGNPFLITTHGTPFDISVSGSDEFNKRTQGASWFGNFNNGEQILFTGIDGSVVNLTGAKTCRDVGMNIQADYFGSFDANISAYDGLGNLLGSFSVAGTSDSNGDGTAPFIGVRSDAGDIHMVSLSVSRTDGLPIDFSINRVSYSCCGAVPEPASLSVLGLGALGLLRRKNKKA